LEFWLQFVKCECKTIPTISQQVILAFPTNQFGHQENGNGQEILNSLKYVRPGDGFEPKAIMFDKVNYPIQVLLVKIWHVRRMPFLGGGGGGSWL